MAEVQGGRDFERNLADIARRLAQPGVLKVGFLEGATYPDGTPVALVAAVQNFGAPSRGIPPRPFFSNMVAEKQSEWGPALGALLAKGYSVEDALNLLGEGIVGQLQQSIVDTNDPPLAASTVKAKGFDTPLIDDSIMINAAAKSVTMS